MRWLPLPALRQLGRSRAARASGAAVPARSRRDRHPPARQGAARQGRAAPDRGGPGVSLRRPGRCSGSRYWLFANHESTLRDAYYRVLTDLQRRRAGGPVQTSGHVGILHELDQLFTLRSGTLREVGIALLAYGLLEGVEAVGLWFTKRWAEYLTFLATHVLLPFEVYELVTSAARR